MTEHRLKLDKKFWPSIRDREKTCEIRFNDRDFQKGDTIKFLLNERCDYMESDFDFIITHVLHFPEGLKDGFVALSIKHCEDERSSSVPKIPHPRTLSGMGRQVRQGLGVL